MTGAREAAVAYLTALIGKTLRITTSDTRMFLGEFKCTDSGRNIILSRTYEYRLPSKSATASAGQAASEKEEDKVVLDMSSRYLGLVVVPGEHIRKIEVEEFASQVKGGSRWHLSSEALGVLS